ncbi:MAG: thioredoxin fold domain-containing protein [Candidatus Eisenbacteria bacterium]
MNRTVLVGLFILVFMVACGRDRDRPEPVAANITWYTSIDEAELDAQQDGDLMLLSFGASWCPWSRLMRESLFVNSAVVESLASVRCVGINIDRDTSLVREFGVVLYPTAVVTDAYGGEIGRMTGYHTPEEFLARLTCLRQREDELAGMFKQEETLANDPTFLIAFGKFLVEMGMYDGALIRFDRATQIDEDDRFGTLEEATYSLAECYMLDHEYKEAARRFRLFTGEYPGSDRAEQAAVLAALCYQEVDYYKVATEIYEDYLETFPDGEFAQFVRARIDSLEARKQNGS